MATERELAAALAAGLVGVDVRWGWRALESAETVPMCMARCDPLLQDCDPGQACHWGNSGFVCLAGQLGQGNIPTGEPCEGLGDCLPGNLCTVDVPACDGECCAEHCDLNNPVCSMMGTECVPMFDVNMAPDGLDHVGICLSPP